MNKTIIIYSELFKKFPEIVFGFSTRVGGVSQPPYDLNLSTSVGDNPDNVKLNRNIFFEQLGIKATDVTFLKQIHSVVINYSDKAQHFEGCDAVYTDKKNNFLAIGVADCVPIFLYEPDKKVCAAVHAGWRGTHEKILKKTLEELQNKYFIDPAKLVAYIGPGISQEYYEVGDEVADLFEADIRIRNCGKNFLDLKYGNYKQLIDYGVNPENIEISELCTFKERELFHSYRRDKNKSGRMFGIIGMIN